MLDVADLTFVDHGGLVALERAARSLDRTFGLRGATRVTAWLVGTLGLTHVTGDPR